MRGCKKAGPPGEGSLPGMPGEADARNVRRARPLGGSWGASKNPRATGGSHLGFGGRERWARGDQYRNSRPKLTPWAQKSVPLNWKAGRLGPPGTAGGSWLVFTT